MDNLQIIGAIKIKDGLFMGDEYSAQDLDFMVTNKITFIINCAGKQIPNIWESISLNYLSFPWQETDSQVIFDDRDENLTEIFNFIETARMKGEGCLVHSLKGLSRSCCVLAGYFMRKFRWTLYKTLEFLHSRRPDLEIRASFFAQMNKLEARLSAKGGIKFNSWDELNEDHVLRDEEIIIRNTYLNSRTNKPSFEEFIGAGSKKYLNKSSQKKPGINWIDEIFRDKSKLATEIKPKLLNSLAFKQMKSKKAAALKSILKPAVSDSSLSNSILIKNPLKTLNNFSALENQNSNFMTKIKGNRPSTPNPEHQRPEIQNKTINSLKDSEMFEVGKTKNNRPLTPNSQSENLTTKTMNNLKEIENSKNLINQLINKNPLLLRKKINNFLEDHPSSTTNNRLIGSEKNIEEDKNYMVNSKNNDRSNSLPKRFSTNNDSNNGSLMGRGDIIKKEIGDYLNRSDQISKDEDEKEKKPNGRTDNESLNYQKLLFENGNLIKKQIQNKLLEEKNKKKGADLNSLLKDPKLSFMNSAIGVGPLPGKKANMIGLNNEKLPGNINSILNKNMPLVGNTNIDSKFNPTQNAHLMSNLINLNLQLNKMNPKKEKTNGDQDHSPLGGNNPIDRMININNFNITTNQVNNININLQKMVPIRATFEIKDPNNRAGFNQSINIDIDKPSSTNNSFSTNKSPNNFIFSKINQNRAINNPAFQQRSISPMTVSKEKETQNQNPLQGKTRLRSSSPAQNHGTLTNEEKYWGLQKPKWKF